MIFHVYVCVSPHALHDTQVPVLVARVQCMTLESWALEHCLGMELPEEVTDVQAEALNHKCMDKVTIRTAQGNPQAAGKVGCRSTPSVTQT